MSDNDDDRATFEHVSTILHPASPVKWTPEDAATFISSAVCESQKPMLLALKRRGVPFSVYFLTVLMLLAVLAAALYYFAWYHEGQWTVREKYLIEQRDAADQQYKSLLSGTAEKSVRVTEDVVDKSRLRDELETAQKRLGAAQVELEKYSLQNADLNKRNKELENDRDLARGELVKLRQTLEKSQGDIANVDKIKTNYQQELEKLRKFLDLQKMANQQQKDEIDLLRSRLGTAQKMVGTLTGEAAEPATVTPAENVGKSGKAADAPAGESTVPTDAQPSTGSSTD